jgi:hypothetical protein
MPRRIRDANVIDAALDGKPEVLSAARYIRTLIGYAAALLALAFTWLSFKGIDFRPVAADITAKQILEVTMALYYALWVAGLKSDTDEQEMLYVAKPSKAHTYFGGAVTATIITALFALLCWVRTPGTFAYALLGFHAMNIVVWLYLSKVVMRKEFRKSERIYREADNFARLEKLKLVYLWYLDGQWQKWRFFVGGIVVVVAAIVVPHAKPWLANIQVDGYVLSTERLVALLLLAYVAIMEGWIWRNRIRMSSQLDLIDELRQKYEFRAAPVR